MHDDSLEVRARWLVLAAGHPVSALVFRVQRPFTALCRLCSTLALLLDYADRDLWRVRPGAAGGPLDHGATLRSPGTTTGGAAGRGARLHRRQQRRMAAGAISAWLVDLQPPDRPGLGSVVGSVAPISGLAAGTLGAGLLVQYGPDPLHLVYWVLLALFVLALASMPFLPDVTERRPGWLASMRPHIGVPRAARSLFAAFVPSLIATRALSALYLSLGPELALSLLHSDSTLAGALVIVALMGPGALAAAVVRAAEPRLLEMRSLFVLIVGVGITLLAVALGSPVGLYAGSVIAGIGYTPAFSAVFRSLVPLAPPDKRAELIASIYVVAYLAFSIPSFIAGVAVTHYSLRETTYVYGLVVMALSAITAVVLWRRRAIPRAAVGAGR